MKRFSCILGLVCAYTTVNTAIAVSAGTVSAADKNRAMVIQAPTSNKNTLRGNAAVANAYKNNQRNNGCTYSHGTDFNQKFYSMECLNCGHKYQANGSDIWQRKCPKCQGGKP